MRFELKAYPTIPYNLIQGTLENVVMTFEFLNHF